MTRSRRLSGLALLALFALPALGQGDCQNQFQYPANSIIPDAGGAITTISTCSFEEEYSVVTSIESGATYRFTLGSQGYITVREGTSDGPVVAQGYWIVDATASSTSDLYAHWNIDDNCSQQAVCQETSVQYFGTCAPPLAFATLVEDCDQQLFTIQVDVQSLGSGGSVNITYDVFGDVNTLTGIGLGVTELGPFFFGDQVNVIVEHETDAACNMDLGLFQESGECPAFIFCGQGPQSFSYCYDNQETKVWNYTSLGGSGSLVLTFISGTIQSSFNDILTIYDGTDNTGTVLYTNPTNNITDLTGLYLASSTGAFHIELTTDFFTSCVDGALDSWNWQVECLNCQLPTATMTNVDDCVNNQFSVPVDVTSLGDGSTVTITYAVNGGTPTDLTGIGLGETVLGPFTINDVVSVFVQHENDPACTVTLGTITDSGNCPNLIVCGQPALVETYCYIANDSRSWSYQSVGSGTLRLTFDQGTIESNTFDHLRIYDGADATGTLVFDHTNFTTYNLGPVGSAVNNTLTNYYAIQIYSTTGSIYMEMSSDGSVQCGDPFPSTNFDSWQWNVVCLDCSIPVGTLSVVDDCANEEFSLDMDITSTGDGATATIEYTVNGGAVQTVTGLGLGVTTIGPFAFGDVVNVVLAHESNSLCNIPFGNRTDTGTCPTLVDCGTELNETYCPGNSENTVFYYQGTGTFPLALFFNAGQLETCCDHLFVYDGPDTSYPLLTPANGVNGDLTGLFFVSTNPGHSLTIRITTDGSISCADLFQVELDYTLSCLDCNPTTSTFSIVQDCENFQYFVDVVVTDMGTDPDPMITNSAGLPPTTVTAVGTYQIGPFVSGTQVQLTVENDANSLCNVYSGTLVNPLCPTVLCGGTPLVESYCYGNGENFAWAYEAPSAGATMNLTFNIGTIESSTFDVLTIRDGADASAPILFQHTLFGTQNLGPAGSAIDSPGSPYYAVNVNSTGPNLYMTLTTDGSVSCQTTAATFDEWEWEVSCVGCSAPGVAYNVVENCLGHSFTTEVIITAPPSADGMTIENLVTGQVQNVTGIGVYEFGPYHVDSLALFGVTDLSEPGCTWLSDSLTWPSDSCVIVSCGFDNYEYCYENNTDRWYTYQSAIPVPTSIIFLQGQMLSGDKIIVYNGLNENAVVIYQGNNGGNLTGFAVNSQNPNNAITLRIQSNGSGSCDDGQVFVPLRWTVGCGAVGIDEVAEDGFSLYPNPTDGTLYLSLGADVHGLARVRVMDMSGRTVAEDSFNANGRTIRNLDLGELNAGQYLVQVSTGNWTKVERVQIQR